MKKIGWLLLMIGTPVLAKEKVKEAPPSEPVEQPDWRQVRSDVESAIRGRLIDPESAKIEWTHGFAWGWWKSFLSKKQFGWVTCGEVNARNRMGGYTGAATFAVVYDQGVKLLDMDRGTDRYGLVGMGCAKAVWPSPQAELIDNAPAASTGGGSIADELAKLAALRDKGIITPAEFDAQKARLLAPH